MKRTKFALEAVITITLITTLITTLCATAPVFLLQQAYTLRESLPEKISNKAPVAISGGNIYVAWGSNKTGNDEVMFRSSTVLEKLLVTRLISVTLPIQSLRT